jgi:predicted anti-sigma-YlaC factor YlaD
VNCHELVEQLSDYLDQEAREELCRAIESHLKICPNCRFEVDSLRKTIVLYQAEREADMPPAVSASLQAALARAYSAEGGSSRTR